MDQLNQIYKRNTGDKKRTAHKLIPLLPFKVKTAELNLYKFIIKDIAEAHIEGYIFNETNKMVYHDLLIYFLGIDGKYDLNKGIMLCGGYGTGKTSIFKIFHTFLTSQFWKNKNMFRISSIEDILNDADSTNFLDTVCLYNMKENMNGVQEKIPIHVLLNEFGHQYDIKKFGTDVNELIELFIMKRYDIFQEYHKVLHITTNYSFDELKSISDPRVADRYEEMFNVVELVGNSFRK